MKLRQFAMDAITALCIVAAAALFLTAILWRIL